MSLRIVIVGDVPERPDRKGMLDRLSAAYPDVQWEWYQAEGLTFQIPQKLLNRLLHELRQEPKEGAAPLRVVKLADLNGRDAHAIYRAYTDPVQPPREIATGDQLLAWLGSAEAGLIPPRHWELPVRAVALLALLAKLIRNKAWNKDQNGHQWVKEDDLLGQAPVMRQDLPRVYGEAEELLGRGTGTLFLTKGGKQGTTPKEWSINTAFLPLVKRAFVERSLASLRSESKLAHFMGYVDEDSSEPTIVDEMIISERILMLCRSRT